MTTADDVLTALESAYGERLAEKATAWQVKHPDEAKLLREEVTAKFRRVGKPDPEPDTFAWQMIEAAIVEAIRVKKGWPTMRQFQELQAGKELPRYVAPVLRPATARIAVDHKALAAGGDD